MAKLKDTRYVEMYRVRVHDILSESSPVRFLPYKDEAREDIHIYAYGIQLGFDTPIMKKLVKTIEGFYAKASEAEKAADFSDYDFDADGHLVLNEKAAEMGKCQLVFEINDFPKKTLFINGPDTFQYYNAKDLEDNAGDIIKKLTEADLIWKKQVKVDMSNQ